MDRLTPEQCGRLAAAVGPPAEYLARLKERMEATGLDHSEDWVYHLVREAEAAARRLWLELEYRR